MKTEAEIRAIASQLADAFSTWNSLQASRREAGRAGQRVSWGVDIDAAKAMLIALADEMGWPRVQCSSGLSAVWTPAGWVVAHGLAGMWADGSDEPLPFAGMRVDVLRALANGDCVSCWDAAQRAVAAAAIAEIRREREAAAAARMAGERRAMEQAIRQAYDAGCREHHTVHCMRKRFHVPMKQIRAAYEEVKNFSEKN